MAKANRFKHEPRIVNGVVSYEMTEEEKQVRRGIGSFWRVNPADHEVYDPPASARIPKEGAWVMITRQLPPIERGLDKKMKVGRCFWVTHEEDSDEAGFRTDGRYKVRCQTPWGDICLWPYEYSKIEVQTLLAIWQAGEYKFHPTDLDAATFNLQVFYARSRGIGIADAMVMALGTINGPVGWFEPSSPELARACADMERRVHQWPVFRGRERETDSGKGEA